MNDSPRLSPEDRAYVEEKTRRMVAVAALRKIQRLVDDYRDGRAPIDLPRPGATRELPPELRAAVPPQARRVAGFVAMLKVQQLVRQYRAGKAADRRAAWTIAIVFATLFAAAAVACIVNPSILHTVLRLLS